MSILKTITKIYFFNSLKPNTKWLTFSIFGGLNHPAQSINHHSNCTVRGIVKLADLLDIKPDMITKVLDSEVKNGIHYRMTFPSYDWKILK